MMPGRVDAPCQFLNGLVVLFNKAVLLDQVPGRIAGDAKLGKDHQIGFFLRGAPGPGENLGEIPPEYRLRSG